MTCQAFRWANLMVAFLLELCALGALGYWGVRAGGVPVAKAALGIGAPLLAAVLWGLFAAPRAPASVPIMGLVVKLLVFGSAAAGLYATGHRALAAAFALLVVANAILVRTSRQDKRARADTLCLSVVGACREELPATVGARGANGITSWPDPGASPHRRGYRNV